MKGVIFPLCAAVAWLTLLFQLRDLRSRWRDPTVVTLCVMVGTLGITFTVATPPVAAAVDRLVGIPNVGAFCIHAAAVTCSFAVQILILLWTRSAERAWAMVRWRLAGLGAVLAIMITLFVLAGVKERAPHFLLQNSDRPLVATYLVFYILALAVGLVAITRMCWRYSGVAGRPWLRRGLRVTAVGSSLTLGYCAARLAGVVGVRLGAEPAGWEILVPLCAGIGTLLGFGGLTLPAWGPKLSDGWRWAGRYRTYHRLYGLWAALYRAIPEIALDPPRSRIADRLSLRDLDLRVYRRVIEIRDGRLALRPWLDPDHATALRAAEAAGLAGDELSAAVEATRLRLALDARAEGRPGSAPSGTERVESQPAEIGDHRGGDLSSEVAWWEEVAQAFASSPGRASRSAAPPVPAEGPSQPPQTWVRRLPILRQAAPRRCFAPVSPRARSRHGG